MITHLVAPYFDLTELAFTHRLDLVTQTFRDPILKVGHLSPLMKLQQEHKASDQMCLT